MDRLKLAEKTADTLLLALTFTLAGVVVTDAHSIVAPLLVAVIVPLMAVSLTTEAIRVHRERTARSVKTLA